MTKTKWALLCLFLMDFILVIFFFTDYYILFFKPTGHLIPLVINAVVLSIISFRSKHPKIWAITGLLIAVPIILLNGLLQLIDEYNYTKIDSPHHQQSLLIEYRHATLGETRYVYNFYKTHFGIMGKKLNGQSILLMITSKEHKAGNGAEENLGIRKERWLTENTVEFSTSKGMKYVYLHPSEPIIDEEYKMREFEQTTKMIENFIEQLENREIGQSITINQNVLTILYDETIDETWIEVSNEYDRGPIPRQQGSRIAANYERGAYQLEECTHQWDYDLYPIHFEFQ